MINHNLTQREQEVLKLVAQAKTNKEITEELFIADCTLDTHLHNDLSQGINKLYKTLQEIKEIAEYSIMHNDNLNSNYQLILQLITKAEEE